MLNTCLCINYWHDPLNAEILNICDIQQHFPGPQRHETLMQCNLHGVLHIWKMSCRNLVEIVLFLILCKLHAYLV